MMEGSLREFLTIVPHIVIYRSFPSIHFFFTGWGEEREVGVS